VTVVAPAATPTSNVRTERRIRAASPCGPTDRAPASLTQVHGGISVNGPKGLATPPGPETSRRTTRADGRTRDTRTHPAGE
jgi:hypothetical protein